MLSLHINNVRYEVPAGSSILDAAVRAGIHIPTLCYLEGHRAQGACRVCAVEVEGQRTLQPACATPVHDGMRVMTHSPRVRRARKTVVELLLSEHTGDCQTCDRSEDCELKNLAYLTGVRSVSVVGEKPEPVVDVTTAALFRDSGKCIKCRRCVTACNDVQNVGALFPQNRGFDTLVAPAFGNDLSTVPCVQCGQCAAVCPTGAITEVRHIDGVQQALDDPSRIVVVQTAPAIRAALGECFGMEPGTLVTGRMVSALRALGFDHVFDTNFTADLTIMEEGHELLARLTRAIRDGEETALPQFTSCSPGWINYAEYFYPEFLPNLSSCKSPQQMFGALAKTWYADTIGVDPARMAVVSVMPCTAKKFEAERPEMRASGHQDVDYVLTTRELGELIQASGIDFPSLPDGEMDLPLGLGSGAADIFANTGGVMEAALRTVYEVVTGRPLPHAGLHIRDVSGLEGVKEASVLLQDVADGWQFLEGITVRVAVAHGLGNAAQLLERIRGGEVYHFVEIMTCPGGCIGGGGQPRFTTDETRRARIDAIYREDEGKTLRTSHTNPTVVEIYQRFLGAPLGHRSHELLHTTYAAKPDHGS